MLHKIILSALLATTATAALGADLPRRNQAQAPFVSPQTFTPASNWSGFYAGVNAGYTWTNVKESAAFGPGTYFLAPGANAVLTATVGQAFQTSGFTGGMQLGYNWQMQNFVLGVEGDINGFGSSKKSFTTVNPYPALATAPATAGYTVNQTLKNTWMGTLRGRLGYSFGDAMIYATGGLAFGGVTATRTFSDTQPVLPQFASTSSTKVGWALGAGMEYALTRNWSVKGEYLYANLGNISTSGLVGPVGSQHVMTTTTSLARHMTRIGVNYRF